MRLPATVNDLPLNILSDLASDDPVQRRQAARDLAGVAGNPSVDHLLLGLIQTVERHYAQPAIDVLVHRADRAAVRVLAQSTARAVARGASADDDWAMEAILWQGDHEALLTVATDLLGDLDPRVQHGARLILAAFD